MNRHHRRAQAAQRKSLERKATIAASLDFLANAAPTATGATLIMPDGETICLAADTARAMAGSKQAGGRA